MALDQQPRPTGQTWRAEMARYAVAALVLGRPVMCDTIEAASPAAARELWKQKFWSSCDEFRAEIPSMDDLSRPFAERMLALMDQTRTDAQKWGATFTARLSRAAL